MYLKIHLMILVLTMKSTFYRPVNHLLFDLLFFFRFEHLGDMVLGLTITRLLMDMFPGLHVGPSTVHLIQVLAKCVDVN